MFTKEVEVKKELGFTDDDCLVIKKVKQIDDKGNETVFDFPKCVQTSKAAGFKGVYSIEFEGEGDPYEGVRKVVEELKRNL